MLVASPLAPVGPLRNLDPSQGVSIDMIVASGGAAAIVLTILLLTVGTSSERRRANRPSTRRRSWLAYTAWGPATVAGLTLALRAGGGRGTASRSLAATTAVAVLLSLCATFVLSAVTLSETPSRYGFDADLIALNAYGDQSAHALERAFGETEDVVAATGFTLVPPARRPCGTRARRNSGERRPHPDDPAGPTRPLRGKRSWSARTRSTDSVRRSATSCGAAVHRIQR